MLRKRLMMPLASTPIQLSQYREILKDRTIQEGLTQIEQSRPHLKAKSLKTSKSVSVGSGRSIKVLRTLRQEQLVVLVVYLFHRTRSHYKRSRDP